MSADSLLAELDRLASKARRPLGPDGEAPRSILVEDGSGLCVWCVSGALARPNADAYATSDFAVALVNAWPTLRARLDAAERLVEAAEFFAGEQSDKASHLARALAAFRGPTPKEDR